MTRFASTSALLLVTAGLFSAGAVNAATVTAHASAAIVSAIGISETTPLNFGQFISGSGADTIIVATTGVRTKGPGTGTLAGGATAAGSFTVSGGANATYALILPASTTLTGSVGAPMTVDTFTTNPTVASGGTLNGSGTQTLLVGATLSVGAGQLATTYTGTYVVEVDYN